MIRAKTAVRRAEADIKAATELAKTATPKYSSNNSYEVLMTDETPNVTEVTEAVVPKNHS